MVAPQAVLEGDIGNEDTIDTEIDEEDIEEDEIGEEEEREGGEEEREGEIDVWQFDGSDSDEGEGAAAAQKLGKQQKLGVLCSLPTLCVCFF